MRLKQVASGNDHNFFCRICIALFKLASCCEYRAVASLFGVGKTSVHRYVHSFCATIARRKTEYIKWYGVEDAKNMAEYIQSQYKYPQAIGAIDGTHIPVRPPLDGKAEYICRKGWPSIVLQAVVDGHYKFRDIYANTAGAAHDSTVFNRSPLSTFIHRQMPKNDIIINGQLVPLHILGDPAYPLSELILKGYTGRNLSPEEESFNVYHSSARMCVEIAFGKLKSRFRILSKTMDVDTDKSPIIVTAYVAFCIICARTCVYQCLQQTLKTTITESFFLSHKEKKT